MEREKFEESWKSAFDKAEVSPSDKVWTNIELDLEKAKGGDLKRRLLFYQMLAAASVVLAMTIGVIGYYYAAKTEGTHGSALATASPSSGEVASGEKTIEDESGPDRTAARNHADAPGAPANTTEDALALSQKEETQRERVASEKKHTEEFTGRQNSIRDNSLLALDENSDPADPKNTTGSLGADDRTTAIDIRSTMAATSVTDDELPGKLQERDLPLLYAPRKISLTFNEQKPEIDPVQAMLAKIEQRAMEVQETEEHEKKKDFKDENLWTSVGFAAGAFNAVQAPGSSGASGEMSSAQLLAAPIVDQESKATGYSYSMGVNLGTRISERWVFQGGVNYMTHNSEYTSNRVVTEGLGYSSSMRFKPATTNDIVNADESELSSKIVYSAPYNVNNSMRYLSIPLQAGYLLVNNTFGLQLNAGVATDLFLQNTVEGDGDQLAKSTQSGGSDSPYRAVNLSGLFGTEFSYRFGPHYRVSLNPGIRYPFNTIYKSELGVQSTPLTFDVGLRFRYIFH